MLLLDTNVVSALVRRELEPVVGLWLDRQDEAQLYVSAITIHEMRYGIEKLATGRRRSTLARQLDELLRQGFEGRILNLDLPASWTSGSIQAQRRRAGRPIGLADCLIAGIAFTRNAALVTRNVTDFAGIGLELVNPWSAG